MENLSPNDYHLLPAVRQVHSSHKNLWCKCVATGEKRWLITNDTDWHQRRIQELTSRCNICPQCGGRLREKPVGQQWNSTGIILIRAQRNKTEILWMQFKLFFVRRSSVGFSKYTVLNTCRRIFSASSCPPHYSSPHFLRQAVRQSSRIREEFT